MDGENPQEKILQRITLKVDNDKNNILTVLDEFPDAQDDSET